MFASPPPKLGQGIALPCAVPAGSFCVTVTVAVELMPGLDCEAAEMVTVIGKVPAVGAIYKPLGSIVPPPEGLTLQFTLEFAEVPVTVAVNCQFAPAPICEGNDEMATPPF